jgi:hypothetical protein
MNYYYKYLKYKNKYLSLKGGNNIYFAVYYFTEQIPNDETKNMILETLKKLYGDVFLLDDFSDFMDEYYMNEIKDFIKQKGKYYPTLSNITVFKINKKPEELTFPINDEKLTFHEYKIRDQLKNDNTNIKLVDRQHGLYSYNLMLIGIENDLK